jgi:hypothetical protein
VKVHRLAQVEAATALLNLIAAIVYLISAMH